MRGKDKVDYCVSLQIELVTVLKNMSLTMSFAEYGTKPSVTAAETDCRQALMGSHFQTAQFSKWRHVIYLYDRKWWKAKHCFQLLGRETEGGKCNNVYRYIHDRRKCQKKMPAPRLCTSLQKLCVPGWHKGVEKTEDSHVLLVPVCILGHIFAQAPTNQIICKPPLYSLDVAIL